MQAYILRTELAKFRRRAWRAYEKRKEYIEAMFGIVHNGVIVVSMFCSFEHTADNASCSFEDDDFDELTEIARAHGLKMLGTIHSHPGMNTCQHLSNQDELHCLANARSEIITGTLHLFKNKGKAYAHPQFSCLWEPVETKYISKHGKIRRS